MRGVHMEPKFVFKLNTKILEFGKEMPKLKFNLRKLKN
jgi:hypothetical protein